MTYALSKAYRFFEVLTAGGSSILPPGVIADLNLEESLELTEPGVNPYSARVALLYLKLRGSGIEDMSRF